MTESDKAFYKWWGSGRDGASTEYPLDLARVAWQASRQQALEEAAQWLDFYDGPGLRRAEHIRSLTTTGDKA